MKKIFIHFTFLMLIFNFYPVVAQIQRDQLLGKWELDYSVTSELMETDVKKAFSSLPEVNHSIVEKAYRGRQMIFMNDNVLEIKLSDGRSSVGGWELDLVKNILKIKNKVNNKDYIYKIVELNSNTLVIEELDLNVKSYFKKLHFIKSKK